LLIEIPGEEDGEIGELVEEIAKGIRGTEEDQP